MPLHDVGYRKWKGELTSSTSRWWMIATTGIAISFRSQWVKRMMLAAWLPVIVFGVFVYIVEDRFIGPREESLERVRKLAEKADIDIDNRKEVDILLAGFKPVDPRNVAGTGVTQLIVDDLARRGITENDPELAGFFELMRNPTKAARIDQHDLQILMADLVVAKNKDEVKEIIQEFIEDEVDPELLDGIRGNAEKAKQKALEIEAKVKDLDSKLSKLTKEEREVFIRSTAMLMGREQYIRNMPNVPFRDKLIEALTSPNNESARRMSWSFFMLTFLGKSQGIATVILIALIVPPLISRDLRSRAYFIYFAKPIGRFEYLVGKFAIPAAFLIFITTLPAIGLFVFGVAMSPDFSVLWDTWHLPLRVLLASAAMIIPTVSLALMLSSLTQESRFATFSWFAIWVLSTGAYLVMMITVGVNDNRQLGSNWQLISLYETIGNVQGWILGLVDLDSSVIGGMCLLAGLTLFSWYVLYQRVSAPIRV